MDTCLIKVMNGEDNMKEKWSKQPYFITVLLVAMLLFTTNAVTIKAKEAIVKPTKVLLTSSEMVCKVGDEFWIYVDKENTVPQNADMTMKWETSDTTIVEVDKNYGNMESCHVFAKKTGTVVLTATSVLDENVKVQCTINVLEGEYSSAGTWVLDKNGNLTIVGDEGLEVDEYKKVKKAKVIITEKCDNLVNFSEEYPNLTQVEFVVRNSSNITSMCMVFWGCEKLISVDFGKLDTSNVTDMQEMFYGCKSLKNIDFTSLNTGKVTNMESMFYGCSSLKTVNFGEIDTSNVTNMSHMFFGCKDLKKIDLGTLNTSKVTDMSYMFSGCSSLKSIDLSPLNTSNVKKIQYIFNECKNLKKINMSGLDLSKIHRVVGVESNITLSERDNESLFYNCKKLEYIDMSNVDLSNAKSLISMFSGCPNIKEINMQNLQIPKVVDMRNMCLAQASPIGPNMCTKLETVDMRGVNAPKLKNMSYAFVGCTGLKNVYFDDMNAPKIENMSGMFNGCSSLKTIDLSSLGFKNCNMGEMFVNCKKLKTVNLNTIHNSTVSSMYGTFVYCTSLENVYLNNLDVSKALLTQTFSFCTSLKTIDLSGWNTSKVKGMSKMFWNCTNLRKLDLGNFETSNVCNMQHMFYNCNRLEELNIENFTLSAKLAENTVGDYIVGVGDMFTGCNLLKYIKTPKNVQVDVRFPHELYASNGGAYAKLPRTGSMELSVNGYTPAKVKPTKFSMNKSSVKIKVGDKISLCVNASTVNASKTVTWKSSNKKIATVNSKGKVKAKKAGTVTITAISKSNKKVKATCKITVYSKIKNVKLIGTKKTLVVGEKLSLKTTVSPKKAEKKFWYRSSNVSVAQVDSSGNVVARKEGVATITVISMENKKVKAEYMITVKGNTKTAIDKKTEKVANKQQELTEIPTTTVIPTSVPATPEVPVTTNVTISQEVPNAKNK